MAREPLERVYGLSAALAAYAARPTEVARIAHTQDQRYALREVLRDAARRRIAYHEVSDEELERICGASHHEGVCVLLRARKPASLEDALSAAGPAGALLALDGVDNPHNVGAIVRTAAYFGIAGVLVRTQAARALPPSAARVAEGGGEHVCVVAVADLAAVLRELRTKGRSIVGFDARSDRAIAEHRFASGSVAVLGNERLGLSREVRACCDSVLAIPGSGALDSLNVSVAAGIVAHALRAGAVTRD